MAFATRPTYLLSFALLGALACKPTDPTDAGDQPIGPVQEDDAAQVMTEQICAQAFECSCPNSMDFADQAACVSSISAELSNFIDPVLSSGGTWDADCAGQMLDAMRDWSCQGPVLAERESSYDPRACPTLKGSLGAGNDCYDYAFGDECQVGLMCLNGTCVQQPTVPVPIGQSCFYGDLPCENGGYCDYDPNGGDFICFEQPLLGDPCATNTSYPCGPENSDLYCKDGTCVAAPAEDESCQDIFLCAPGLYCDGGQDFTCQPRQELGEGCGGDAVCPVDASCVMNLCEADPAAVCFVLDWF